MSCRQAEELMSLSCFAKDSSKSHLRRVEAVGALYLLFSFFSARKRFLWPGSFLLAL